MGGFGGLRCSPYKHFNVHDRKFSGFVASEYSVTYGKDKGRDDCGGGNDIDEAPS